MSSIDRLREWLLADTLPVWLEKGYDRANRSFHERLSLDFSPVTEGGKRVLVQARQIYTYSSSASSIAGALDAAQSAFEFTEAKYRHPAGGWRHRVTHEGAPLDDSRDLYDQAFVVFACAVLYRATGREDVLAAALETLRYLEAERSHPAGGFTEIVPGDGSAFEGLRRQNPHMHLFEAMLALHESTDDDSHLEMATRLFELTRSKFIVDNTLREYFTDALDPVQGEAGEIVEP
ncbi:MAG: AGE family epimerase/isomerase, partial [Pseudomonadota bacterium]|nr:AGE family epimerase/isomerase [Pseudomonadota bacterium]